MKRYLQAACAATFWLAAGPTMADWKTEIMESGSPLLWHDEELLSITCFADDASLLLLYKVPPAQVGELAQSASGLASRTLQDGAIGVSGNELRARLIVQVGEDLAGGGATTYTFDPDTGKHRLILMGDTFDDAYLDISDIVDMFSFAADGDEVSFRILLRSGVPLESVSVSGAKVNSAAERFIAAAELVGCD